MPELTADRLRELLDYDPETGFFCWRVQLGKARVGDIPTCVQRYYVLQIDKKRYCQHRLAWLWVHGEWPKGQIDHIDGNPLNNRISNLRDVTMAENMQNRGPLKKTSGLPTGVTSNGCGGFNANIRIGTYNTPEEAHFAYLHAKRLFHSGYTGRLD